MAIAVPTTASDFSTASSAAATSVTVNKPANIANGDLLIAVAYFRNASSTFTPPSGWTVIETQNALNSSYALYYKKIPTAGSEPSTYTWSFTGGSARVYGLIFRVTGTDATTAIDAVGTEAVHTGTTSIVVPAVTAVSAAAMLIVWGQGHTTTTTHPAFTAPSGMTELIDFAFDDGSASTSATIDFQLLSALGSTGTKTIAVSPTAANTSGFAFTLNPAVSPAPTAVITSLTPSALTVAADGTGSSAVGPATITGYDWNWGDATSHGTGSTASHTYAAAGTYTVTLTVTDSNANTNTATSSVTVAAPSGTVTARSAVTTGWTASSGTALSCITDSDPTTFDTSSANPTALEFDFVLFPMTPPATGQPLKVFLTMDALLASSATLAAQLYEGATSRSTLTGVTIPAGSGSTVVGLVTLTFPWSDVQNVTTGGWNAGLTVKLQVTAS